MNEIELRQAVCTEAQRWLGTPYHHEAAVLGHGVDCGMLLVRVYNDVGVMAVPDPRPYAQDWNLHRSQEMYLGWVDMWCEPTQEPQPGDIVVWRFGRTFSHGGIYVGDGLVLHAWRNVGEVTLTEMLHPELKSRDHASYTLRKWQLVSQHGR